MSLFPNSHEMCEEQENKHPHSQERAGKAESFNVGHVSVQARRDRSPEVGWSYTVEKGVYQWMKRVPEGQQEGLGCGARKTKRMSKGEDGDDGNRKRQPSERLTFRVEARHASSGEVAKTK